MDISCWVDTWSIVFQKIFDYLPTFKISPTKTLLKRLGSIPYLLWCMQDLPSHYNYLVKGSSNWLFPFLIIHHQMALLAQLKHESKYCPRCNQPFECKSGSITECQCFGLQLNAEVAAFVAEKYTDCLCRNCLLQFHDKALFFHEKFRTPQ